MTRACGGRHQPRDFGLPCRKSPTGASASASGHMRELARVPPESAVFVFPSFEGPPRYSMAGGLGTCMPRPTRASSRASSESHPGFFTGLNAPGEILYCLRELPERPGPAKHIRDETRLATGSYVYLGTLRQYVAALGRRMSPRLAGGGG